MIFRGLSFELTLSLPYCLLPSITSTSRHFQVSLSRLYALSPLQCFPLSMFSTEYNSAIIPLASLRRAEVRDLLWENDVNTTAKTKTKRRRIESEEEGAKGREKSCKRLLENSGRSWRYCRKTRTKEKKKQRKRKGKLTTLWQSHNSMYYYEMQTFLSSLSTAEMKNRQQRNWLCT